MRVFLDTNVLVSAFTARGLCSDVLQVVLVRHDMVLGQAVLDELARVLFEKMGVPRPMVAETRSFLLREAAELVSGPGPPVAFPEADDALVLGQAAAARADVFVTGDRALLDAEGLPVPVVSPRGFWERVRSAGAG